VKRFDSLIDALRAAPAERRFVTFWIDEDEHEDVTFGEFRRRAAADARLLLDRGIAVGDRVVILMPQGIPAMSAFVGAMMLGAVPALLAYPNFKIEPSKYRLGLAGVTANLVAKAVVIDPEFPEELLEHVSLDGGAQLLRTKGIDGLRDPRELSPIQVRGERLAFIQHSAGTTGLQKGVALTHHAVLTQLDHLVHALQIDESVDRIYSWLPLYHDMGLIACFMLPLVCHLPIVMQSPLDWVMHPETMLQLISDYKCTLAWMPNFAFQFIPRRFSQNRWRQFDLSSVRALINCSEPVRGSSFDEFRKAASASGLRSNALQSSYAMAENVFAVTQSDISHPGGPTRILADGPKFRSDHVVVSMPEGSAGAIAFTSSGRLLPHHEIRIVSENGAKLGDGHVGEIFVRSDCLFQGYYNRDDLTAEALADGWYRTGDLGFQMDGELFVVGRKKDLLIIGGENLYPQDIEEIVAGRPEIHDGRAIAMGLYNPDLGTEDIIVVAEVEREELLKNSEEIESAIRSSIVSSLGVSVRKILLKPPKWIVKSTAGKPARSSTREKLFREHPELRSESQEILE
jgi:acyl-CoA synthetase (AMP-forming)/AMP-acid ligase II